MAGKKILVADDSLTIQKVIRLALSGDGYEIQTVSDGKEAAEQASLFRPDICIIDVSLPQMDAYQFREHMLSKPDLKNVPVILMSSTFEKVDEQRAEQLGFAGHLIKPFDPSHLRSTLLSVSNQTPKNDPITATINEPYIRLQPPNMQDFPPLDAPPMDDIQTLTRNTFSLSGLDQQEWGMFEPGKALEPEPAKNEVSGLDFDQFEPLSPMPEAPMHHTAAPSISSEEIESMVRAEVAKALEQIKNEFRELSRSSIPDIAERIIKDEIHKLLSSPPQ